MQKIIILILVLFASVTSQAKEEVTKKLSEKLIGKWEIDKESMTEFMKKEGKSKEDIDFVIALMENINLEVTETKIKILNLKKEIESISYTVVSEKDGVLKVKNGKDKVSLIKFIDDDKIEIILDETYKKDRKIIFKRKK